MKNVKKLFMAMLTACPLTVWATGADEVVEALRSADCYEAVADYQVLMSLQPDVDYTIKLRSQSAPGDSLAPCSYLVSWHVGAESDSVSGFCAYADGNMLQYRGQRLQEYHAEQNATLFQPTGQLPGVQIRGQFTNLLPQFIADEMAAAMNDPRYDWRFTPDTVAGGQKCMLFEAVMKVDGNVCKEMTYAFDRSTYMPMFSETENNPGALAEQTIVCRYKTQTDIADCGPITEQKLAEMFPQVFELYRESTFSIDNLPGQALPTMTLPTTTGERYTRHRGDRFAHPTLIVLLSANSCFARQTVADVRRAVSTLPDNVDVIWAFTDNNTDDIETVVVRPEPGEHLLQSAKALARDCGASVMPVIIFTGTDGIVKNVIVGFNKNLAADVIEKAIHLK